MKFAEDDPLRRFQLVEISRVDLRNRFIQSVRKGLSGRPRSLPSFLFYDERGSKLFEAICELPEYYPFRTERKILQTYANEIISEIPRTRTVIELGSGNASKTRFILQALTQQHERIHYLPLDIDPSAIKSSAPSLLKLFPEITLTGLVGEYHDCFQAIDHWSHPPRLVLWLGSNIGNLEPDDAIQFLQHLRRVLGPEDTLLIGFDRDKDPSIILPAYNDAQGITEQFNKNILYRINQELGGNFVISQFKHLAVYNHKLHRIEMYLESIADQTVHIKDLDMTLEFLKGERIHTENSYKFTDEMINEIITRAGWSIHKQWTDPDNWFLDCLCI